MSEKLDYGKPPINGIRYCIRCCYPETVEGVEFDDMGICRACQSSEQKIHINWQEREKALRAILQKAKEKAGDNYDCILPISGGKDSVFQMYVLTHVYKMKPLAVTFNHNWYSKTGWYNLVNCLEVFKVDHMMFTPSRDLVNLLAQKSIGAIGDACWHCHAGLGAFPLHIAQKFKIPLLVYGESISDASGRASYDDPRYKFDRDYFVKVSAKVKPHKMVCNKLSMKDLHLFEPPSPEELEEAGVWGIHLGDYIFWDDERQTEFIKKYFHWKEIEMEGAYKGYKSVECIMQGVHDFMCYLKRGFGRTTWQASVDVRNGLMTREEAFEIIKKYDRQVPEALKYFLTITDLSEERFYELMKSMQMEGIKGINLPIDTGKPPCGEIKNKPYVQQLIEEVRNTNKYE